MQVPKIFFGTLVFATKHGLSGLAGLNKIEVGEGHGTGTESATRSLVAAVQHPRLLLAGASPGRRSRHLFSKARAQGERGR